MSCHKDTHQNGFKMGHSLSMVPLTFPEDQTFVKWTRLVTDTHHRIVCMWV